MKTIYPVTIENAKTALAALLGWKMVPTPQKHEPDIVIWDDGLPGKIRWYQPGTFAYEWEFQFPGYSDQVTTETLPVATMIIERIARSQGVKTPAEVRVAELIKSLADTNELYILREHELRNKIVELKCVIRDSFVRHLRNNEAFAQEMCAELVLPKPAQSPQEPCLLNCAGCATAECQERKPAQATAQPFEGPGVGPGRWTDLSFVSQCPTCRCAGRLVGEVYTAGKGLTKWEFECPVCSQKGVMADD